MKKRIASAVLALCLTLALLPVNVWAAGATSGTWGDNLTWTYDQAAKTMTITGSGNMADSTGPSSELTKEVEHIVIGPGVTSIGKAAFSAWSSLVSITIPDSVISIGEEAFFNTGLTRVSLPNSALTIEKAAFSTNELSAIYIPASVKTIKQGAFSDNLRDIYYGGTEEQWTTCGGSNSLSSSCHPVLHYGAKGLPNISANSADMLQQLLSEGNTAGLTDIQLTGAIDLGSKSLTIPAGSNVRIDLNKCNLTSKISPVIIVEGSLTIVDRTAENSPIVGADDTVNYSSGRIDAPTNAIDVRNGGNFTLKSGTIKADKNAILVRGEESNKYPDKTTSVLIEGGYVESQESAVALFGGRSEATIQDGVLLSRDNAVVAGNGLPQYAGTTIYMHGGTLIGQSTTSGYIPCGIYHPQEGTVSISGGSIRAQGGVGVLMRGGKLKITQNSTVKTPPEIITGAPGNDSGRVGDSGEEIPVGHPVVLDQKSGYYNYTKIRHQKSIFELSDDWKDALAPFHYFSVDYGLKPEALSGQTGVTSYNLWKIGAYSIRFESNGGTSGHVPAEQITVDNKLPADFAWNLHPTREGYDFDGWYTQLENGDLVDRDHEFTEDTIVYAHWKPKGIPDPVYTVTFDLNDQDTPHIYVTKTTVDGKIAEWPNDPTRIGFIFKGWFNLKEAGTLYIDGANFTQDTTLYAQWEPVPKTYTITLNANGGTFPENHPTTVTTGSDGKLTALPQGPTRENYTFKRWTLLNGTAVTIDTEFTRDTTIYAQWEKADGSPDDQTCTVSFDLNYENAPAAPAALATGADHKLTSALPSPERTGYTFDGWFTDRTGGVKIEGDDAFFASLTLYAHWTANTPDDKPKQTFTIKFDLNYTGAAAIDDLTTGEDGKLAALPEKPKRDGYTFDGWFSAASGGTAVTTATVFTQNDTVYAHWTAVKPSTPSTDRYPIYAPGSVSGGRVYVSHSYAAEGTRVTIEISPRSNYELDWLSVTNLDTGRSVRLTERYWDEYTFIMPASAVEIEVSYDYIDSIDRYNSSSYFILAEPQIPTGPNAWYYRDRHIYHVTNGLVPDSTPITRDMFLSVLYNLTDNRTNGSTAVGSETNDAQTWATSHNIVPDIYASGLWGPDKALSREQAAMLIFGYAGYRNYSVSQGSNLTRYIDYNQLRPIARTAMSWVLATNLMPSTTASTLSPQEALTCGQAGNLLFQFQTNVARNFSYY